MRTPMPGTVFEGTETYELFPNAVGLLAVDMYPQPLLLRDIRPAWGNPPRKVPSGIHIPDERLLRVSEQY